MALTRPFQQLQHDVAGTVATAVLDHPVERLQPLGGLSRIRVREVRRQAIEDLPDLVLDAHVGPLVAMMCTVGAKIPRDSQSVNYRRPQPPRPACKPVHTMSGWPSGAMFRPDGKDQGCSG